MVERDIIFPSCRMPTERNDSLTVPVFRRHSHTDPVQAMAAGEAVVVGVRVRRGQKQTVLLKSVKQTRTFPETSNMAGFCTNVLCQNAEEKGGGFTRRLEGEGTFLDTNLNRRCTSSHSKRSLKGGNQGAKSLKRVNVLARRTSGFICFVFGICLQNLVLYKATQPRPKQLVPSAIDGRRLLHFRFAKGPGCSSVLDYVHRYWSPSHFPGPSMIGRTISMPWFASTWKAGSRWEKVRISEVGATGFSVVDPTSQRCVH